MNVEKISREEFEKLCEEIYRDRLEIYGFNPGATHRDALLWMLLGCLISLLSITSEELEALTDSSGSDYGEVVCQLLRARAEPTFDARPHVEELVKRAEND